MTSTSLTMLAPTTNVALVLGIEEEVTRSFRGDGDRRGGNHADYRFRAGKFLIEDLPLPESATVV